MIAAVILSLLAVIYLAIVVWLVRVWRADDEP